MNQNLKSGNLLGSIALAFALAAGASRAQIVHVAGDGVIGDAPLVTTAGTALVGVTGGSWKTNGGLGAPVSSTLISPAVAVPTSGNVTLAFTHRHDFEIGFDGGAVFIAVNGNPAAYVPGTAFTSNGYTGNTLAESSAAWSGGENVFYGQSAGYATTAMITSVANLGVLNAGDLVSVHFKGEWDGAELKGPPAWEIGTVKLTDAAASDFLNVNFATQGGSGFTVANVGPPAGPWSFSQQTADLSFEINGDTLAADRYVPDVPGSVLNLSNADIIVELLAGTLEGGEVFSLFDLTGGTTLAGTPASVSLPPLGIWNTANLAVNGTITFVSPPPNLTWTPTAPGNGVWDLVTPNWTANGVDPALFVASANATFNKADGGIVTVAGMTPTATTVDSAGNYTFTPGVTPGIPSILGGTLTKSGSGTLQLGDSAWANTANAGTYKNDFTAVQVNAGTVRYGSQTALGTGTVTMENGTTLIKIGQEGNGATLAMANPFVLNGQVTVRTVFSGMKDQWFSGVISGPGGLRITGERRAVTLTGNNSFAGGVTMENYDGTAATAPYNLDIGHVNALGSGTLTVKTVLNPLLTQFRGLGTTTALVADSGVPNDIVVETGATFYLGRGQNLRLGGDISGAGAVFKRNTTTVFLDGTNTYGGGTRVEAGTLTIGGSLADASMNLTGGTVNGTGTLTFNVNGTTADQIVMTGGTLTATDLDIVVNPTGAGLNQAEYILVSASGGTITGPFASLSGAPGYSLNYDTPGQVKLVNPSLVAPYTSWSGGAAAEVDTNGDGVANAVAWVVGAADPAAPANGLLPTLDPVGDPDFFIFNYRRSDPAAADTNTTIKVQYGSSLAGWTDAVPGTDIVITPFNDFHGTGVDKVEVKIRRTLAANGRLFTRLHVTVATP